MRFYADLHIHSKYSRATSKDCDLEHLSYWGRKKGITVIGTGDFTHPAWFSEISEKLVPAEPGLFRLRDDIDKEVTKKLPESCHGITRFMLSVEISTIYKKGEKTRKIHHLIYAPTLEQADFINRKLNRICCRCRGKGVRLNRVLRRVLACSARSVHRFLSTLPFHCHFFPDELGKRNYILMHGSLL